MRKWTSPVWRRNRWILPEGTWPWIWRWRIVGTWYFGVRKLFFNTLLKKSYFSYCLLWHKTSTVTNDIKCHSFAYDPESSDPVGDPWWLWAQNWASFLSWQVKVHRLWKWKRTAPLHTMYKYIILFIYYFCLSGCAVSLSLLGLSPVSESKAYLLLAVHGVLLAVASLAVERRF